MLIFTHCKCLYYRRSGIGRVFFYLSLSLFRYVYPRAISKWKVLIGPLTFFFLFFLFSFFLGRHQSRARGFFLLPDRHRRVTESGRQQNQEKKRERDISDQIAYRIVLSFSFFFLVVQLPVVCNGYRPGRYPMYKHITQLPTRQMPL